MDLHFTFIIFPLSWPNPESIWRICLYLEEYRGKGFGKSLLIYLANLAMEKECGRLEWAVLDWNEPSIEFYKSLGARMMDEWIVNRVTGEAS